MRAVGIIGYQNSGKTTLATALTQELVTRGHDVAAVKHSSHQMDLAGKDTARLKGMVDEVAFISPYESGLFLDGKRSLEEMLAHLDAELVIIEGFKQERSFPKIACLRGEPEDENLLDGLALCAVGPVPEGVELEIPLLSQGRVKDIADLVEERAFKLPNLDCGDCGFETCYEMAREIVKGNRTVEDCVSLRSRTEVRIDGERLPLNSFISELIASTIRGLLAPLKSCSKGRIEIKI